jgi:hypothetical protein
MRLFGYKHLFAPNMLGWHDRSTTKELAGSFWDHLTRIRTRRRISIAKRRLDWSNVRFTIIKNAHTMNLLWYAPWFLAREIAVAGYTSLFEPRVFLEFSRFFRLLPRMLRRRRKIMAAATVSSSEMRSWLSA